MLMTQTRLEDWYMQLERVAPCQIGSRPESMIVIDIETDNSGYWPLPDIRVMQNAGKHKLLAHLNIAVAQDHRPYWHPTWRQEPPFWMTKWAVFDGGRPVQYWNPTWQKMILDMISHAVKSGFDGLYLSGVGEFARQSSQFPNAAKDMGKFLRRIHTFAREQGAADGFRIIAENAGELIYDQQVRKLLAGVAQNGLLFNDRGEAVQAPNYSKTRALLTLARTTNLPVFVYENVKTELEKEHAVKELKRMGFSPFVTIRGS